MRAINVLLTAALVLFAVPAAAQTGQGGPGGGQGRNNELLFKDITLTEVQKAKVDSIQSASRDAMRAMMQSGGMQDSATRATMAGMRTKQMADIRALLTPEQQIVFDKNVAAMPPMGGGRRPPTS